MGSRAARNGSGIGSKNCSPKNWTPVWRCRNLETVSQSLIVQGRLLDGPELENLRQWVGEHQDWSRRRLSRELATRWGWCNGAGVLKDMATRTLLGKLHQRGLVELPARRQTPTNR